MLNIKYLLEICLGATDLKSNEYLSVSVVVPFYNRSGFLKRLLDSVAVQTLPADKVYIIDNGSSLEETLKAWEIITDHIIYDKCVFTSSIGKGNANYARNLGYELADTKYVAFLDSDDWWEKEHLSSSITQLLESSKVAIYSGAIAHRVASSVKEKSIDVNSFDEPFSLILSPKGYLAQTSSYIVNKQALGQSVLWDEDLKRHQDFDYFTSIFFNTSGWHYSSEPYVNIDWTHTNITDKKIDFNSLVLFYTKWHKKMPENIRCDYLISMLYLAYRLNADIRFKSFYRDEILKEDYASNWRNKLKINPFYILFRLGVIKHLEKLGLKQAIKKLI